MGNADGLSRLTVPHGGNTTQQPYEMIHLMERLNTSLVTATNIREWMSRDPTLAKVRKQVMFGWPNTERNQSFYKEGSGSQCRGWMSTLGHESYRSVTTPLSVLLDTDVICG